MVFFNGSRLNSQDLHNLNYRHAHSLHSPAPGWVLQLAGLLWRSLRHVALEEAAALDPENASVWGPHITGGKQGGEAAVVSQCAVPLGREDSGMLTDMVRQLAPLESGRAAENLKRVAAAPHGDLMMSMYPYLEKIICVASEGDNGLPGGGWLTLAVGAGVALVKIGWLSGQIAKKEAIQE
ncbi:hypothetical protein CEUSTIGMA_g7015.t1 [Chlamydomonas eustigma]|uniref:Uncharacterized protein n=1 Tax=Chlamydomonas eustigma TaxID=1157962 RepID=A0A250X921_9CHLO|nr:hypothetical protein CEUSTIGMA_g7015.t1 [Chlamydomonas eustigma]|eukprot:GAX79574.1 hypothetical protein CEUSTIGMA_g7015.t1 [Chlamydomonas eustigma]